MKSGILMKGRYTVTIYRADGRVEQMGPISNLCPDDATEQFAQKLLDEQTSRMAHMAVGTVSTAPAMADTTLTGEAARKALSLNASSLNTMVQVATFGGAADSLTSVDLVEVGLFNHASSGQGQIGSRITFSSSTVTLAQSDLVKFEVVTEIGSHT